MSTVAYAAAACELAIVIFYARQQAFGLPEWTWHNLEPNEKAKYVARATELLESLRPATRADYFALASSLARAEAKNVIGRITPTEPYGVDTRPEKGTV